MSLSSEEFHKLCKLARLFPDPENSALIMSQCDGILAYMDLLQKVDTLGVEPLYSPLEHSTLYREDVAERRCTREEILANAPETDGDFFIVPRIVEGK